MKNKALIFISFFAIGINFSQTKTKPSAIKNSINSSPAAVHYVTYVDNPIKNAVNFGNLNELNAELKQSLELNAKFRKQTFVTLYGVSDCNEVSGFINRLQESNETLNNYFQASTTTNSTASGNVSKMNPVSSISEMVEILPNSVDNMIQISKSKAYTKLTILMKDFVENSKANSRSYKLVYAISSYLNLNSKANLLIELPAFSSDSKKEKNTHLEYFMLLLSQQVKPSKSVLLQNRIQVKQKISSNFELPVEEITLMNEEIFNSTEDKIQFYLYY